MWYEYGDELSPQEAKKNFKKFCIFLNENKKTIYVVGSGIFGLHAAGGLKALLIVLAKSSPVNICGTIIHIQDMKKLFKELQSLDVCEPALKNLHQILADDKILDSKKSDFIQLLLFDIDGLPDKGDIKSTMINCFVKLITALYFFNLDDYDLLIQALIDALKKGKLSSRLFHIILRMLQNRGIPIDGILEAIR